MRPMSEDAAIPIAARAGFIPMTKLRFEAGVLPDLTKSMSEAAAIALIASALLVETTDLRLEADAA